MNRLYVVYLKPPKHSACGPERQAAITIAESAMAACLKIEKLFPERKIDHLEHMNNMANFKSNWFYVE